MSESDCINLIASLATLIASITGIWAILTWRKEVKFKRKYELAEKVLANAYEAVAIINIIRSPASRSDEGQSRKRDKNETPKQTEQLNQLYVIIERYHNNNDSFKRLYAIRFQLKAVFGDKLEDSVSKILNKPKQIINTVNEYADTIKNPNNYTEKEKQELAKKYRNTVFGPLTKEERKEDFIYKEMKKALDDIEKVCRKYLK